MRRVRVKFMLMSCRQEMRRQSRVTVTKEDQFSMWRRLETVVIDSSIPATQAGNLCHTPDTTYMPRRSDFHLHGLVNRRRPSNHRSCRTTFSLT